VRQASRALLPAAFFALFVNACSARPEASPGRPPPAQGVVVVSICSLRADHLGCYGYGAPTSPRTDALAREAVVFREAITHAPSTFLAHASLFTSLIPPRHGASFAAGKAMPPQPVTLAEVLKERGFATASFNGGGQLDRVWGLDQGFDVYETPSPAGASPLEVERLEAQVDAAIAWLDRQRDPRFFLFIHTYEVHHGYTPRAADLALFDGGYRGPLPPAISVELLARVNAGRIRLSPRDLEHVVAAYDGEIRSADRALGRLLDHLRSARLYDRSLIIVTSDHGEEFGEHGGVGRHSHALYDELLRVPLIVKFGGSWRAGGSLDAQVRLIDVAPTILGALALPVPPAFEGSDLLPYVAGGPAPPPYALVALDGGVMALRTPQWKWQQGRLFNLRTDPGESTDVARRFPQVERALRRVKRELVNGAHPGALPKAEVSRELRQRLQALGYVE